MRGLRRAAVPFLVALTTLAVGGAVATDANASKVKNGKWLQVSLNNHGGDAFDNYDYAHRCQPHGTTNCGARSRSAIDMPISLIFTNNAEIDKVKSRASRYPSDDASLKNAIVSRSWGWDEDRGRKMHSTDGCSKYTTNYHFRTYADGSDDRLYNVDYGYFVIASAHNDYRENCSSSKTVSNETVEHDIAHFYYTKGAGGGYDRLNIYNGEHNTQGTHVFATNGWASIITIPSSW